MEVNGYTIEPGATLQQANLQQANLEGADLLAANLEGASLSGQVPQLLIYDPGMSDTRGSRSPAAPTGN